MPKKKRQPKRSERRQTFSETQRDFAYGEEQPLVTGVKHKKAPPLEAKTEAQGLYISTILHSDISFGLGPAGTGKTYVATVLACEALEAGQIERIILTRPAVDTENFGALPGELEDKYGPYIEPFQDIMVKFFGEGKFKYLLKAGKIVASPLAFMRGKTFDDAWILLDEAQNTTPGQMKMVLTRIGQNSRLVISGDMNQNDLPRHIQSGLNDAVKRLEGIPEIGVVEFEKEDCVRHGIISKILERYDE